MIRVLFFLQSAFSLWMLVDAFRRGAERYWYAVIMFPFGEWAYFFMVKIHDPEFAFLTNAYKRLTTKKQTIQELRYLYETTPSFNNRLVLAQALFDNQVYAEAQQLFSESVAVDGSSSEARYGLARCHLEAQAWPEAIEQLKIMTSSSVSSSAERLTTAYSDLAHALVQNGQLDEAVRLLETWAEGTPRLDRRLLLAHYLTLADRRDEARQQIETGLLEHQQAPKYLKQRQRAWVKQAKNMLQGLAQPASPIHPAEASSPEN